MAVSLGLIGIVFLLTYAGGIRGEVIVTVGAKRIKCRMKTKALNDMVEFLERFYELKLNARSSTETNGTNGHGTNGNGTTVSLQ
tara:strand:+ start:642 stop:893 length:252 start_codon:yes stop_codon:yes gene_type:complete